MVLVSEYIEPCNMCKKFILSIVGNDVYSKFCTQYPVEETDMLREFETKYKHLSSFQCNAKTITLHLPVILYQLRTVILALDNH